MRSRDELGERHAAVPLTRARIGVFGGTFDPPHVGHLLAAVDAHDLLSLDRVIFVPAAEQPFKAGATQATPAQRLAMVERLVADDPRFAVDATEIRRKGLSYTVETMVELAARYPDAERFLLLGADAFASFEQWREPDRIRSLARIAVLHRGEREPAAPVEGATDDPSAPLWVRTRRIDISSSEIRARVGAGRPIRGFVTEAVADYIASARLYR